VKSKYTLLIIPPNDGQARQIQFSLRGKRILISGLITLGVLIISLFSYNLYLSHTLKTQEAAIQNVNQLNITNQEKDQEIKKLQEQSLQMSQDLSTIHELELKISSILKVEPAASPMNRGVSVTPQSLSTTGSSTASSDPAYISKQLTLLEHYYDLTLEHQDQIDHTPSILPLEGEIASPFGYRNNPFGGRSDEFHNGVDFAVNYGTPVVATAAGTVIFADWDPVYGRKVEIDHGSELVTFYGHNSKLTVKQGDTVQKGEIIAYSGNSGRSTGAHLHYGALDHGQSIDPLTFTKFTKEQ
jgi:murein DD-endopeptidase MepM/ murein hydrolase activator NlpD